LPEFFVGIFVAEVTMKKLLWIYFAILGTAHASDRWWEIRIADQPSGYQHTLVENLDGGNIRTTEEQLIVINRLGSRVQVKVVVQSLENAAGELQSLREETSSSAQTLITESEFRGDKIEIRSTAGSNSYTRSMPLRAPLCGPMAFTRMTREQLNNPGDQVTCRQYQSATGPYRLTRTLLGREEIEGHPVLRAKMTIGDTPGDVTLLLDLDGEIYKMESDGPFGKMTARAVDREAALQAAAGGSLPAESYDRTLARSNIRFADARAVERIRLKITHKKPELGWPLLRGPSQTIIEKTPTTVILEITRPEPRPVPNEVNEAQYLKPNQILQSDDAEVVRLAREIAGDEPDRFKAARRLQDWVANNLSYDLGIALAPASEVVRNRRGACVAYAVLLASMARAVGIPSRVPMGYIYTGGIWGGHAWVEVLIDGQWLPLDAAGYRPGVADAARFQFDSYTMQDNLLAGSLAGLQLYGNVDVKILEYSIGGKTVHLPESVRAYSIEGDVYRNEWLGFSVRKPEGFTFGKTEAVWPDRTVLSIEGDGVKVTTTLLEAVSNDSKLNSEVATGYEFRPVKLAGRDAVIASNAEKARLVSREGQSVWMITAEGRNAQELLDRVIAAWTWISPK
jgi:hypothetical protein